MLSEEHTCTFFVDYNENLQSLLCMFSYHNRPRFLSFVNNKNCRLRIYLCECYLI
jgi:hypothetical protein